MDLQLPAQVAATHMGLGQNCWKEDYMGIILDPYGRATTSMGAVLTTTHMANFSGQFGNPSRRSSTGCCAGCLYLRRVLLFGSSPTGGRMWPWSTLMTRPSASRIPQRCSCTSMCLGQVGASANQRCFCGLCRGPPVIILSKISSLGSCSVLLVT